MVPASNSSKLILSYQLQAGPLSLDSVCTEHETHDYDQFKNIRLLLS